MSSITIPFDNSLESWAKHFKLSPQAIEVLRDFIGLVAFEDLALIYHDDHILDDLQNLLKRLDYVKFMNAKEPTLQMLANEHERSNDIPSKPSASIGEEHKEPEIIAIPEISLNESIDDFISESEGVAKAFCPVIPSTNSQLFTEEELSEVVVSEPVVAVPLASVMVLEEEIETRNSQLNNLISIIDDEMQRRKEARYGGSPSPERIARLVESSPLPPPAPRRPDISDLRKFLLTPLSSELGTVLCSFVRNRIGDHRHNPSYSVFLEDGHHFMMSASRKNGVYRVAISQEDGYLRPDQCLAEIKSNFMGTEYQFLMARPEDLAANLKLEIGAVCYERKAAFNQSPRCMDVVMPVIDGEGGAGQWSEQEQGENLLSRIKRKNFNGLLLLKNRPPQWNNQLNCYVLNFKGRVSMASVKNFQLVRPGHENDVILQFGKVGSDFFVMDMKHPITPLQAFCLSLSSFDN
eukprot:gene5316-5701_t